MRELESSMSRMGQQHDVTMELIETWRNNKEAVSSVGLLCLASLFGADAAPFMSAGGRRQTLG